MKRRVLWISSTVGLFGCLVLVCAVVGVLIAWTVRVVARGRTRSEFAKHMLQGSLYDRDGLYKPAITEFSAAIAIEPNSLLAYANRGSAYKQDRRPDPAILDLNVCIRRTRGTPD